MFKEKLTGIILGLMATLIIFSTELACNQSSARPTASTQYVCKEGPDEKCPDPIDYAVIKEFQAKYKAPQPEQDAINGLWMRLLQNPPDGYYWQQNNEKAVYVRVPKGQHWDKFQSRLVQDPIAAAK